MVWFAALFLAAQWGFAAGDGFTDRVNLLKNPTFEFHTFLNHRDGKAGDFESGYVAFWNADAGDDVHVVRESHVDPQIRPAFSTGNLTAIRPGKRLYQFFTLPESRLAHGDIVSLKVFGHQTQAGTLKARIKLMKLDSEDGEWSPKTFKFSDSRTFPKHSRGELVAAGIREAQSDKTGPVVLEVANVKIDGCFHDDNKSYSADRNIIGIEVEFLNTGTSGDVWVYAPTLVKGVVPCTELLSMRSMIPHYRNLPRTIQKLWKGVPVHIILMGSSIDRGSANPPCYLYDENPASSTFKQPLSETKFEAEKVGRPDLDGYVGQWRHFWTYAGRLRLELMRKFNLPVNKLLLNFMAVDGSCIAESHSAFADYASLSIPPGEETNGHKTEKTWQELYPDLFNRPEGPRPDLVIFGSGANEKIDTPDEVAVFEGAIRWFQRHYPGTEFLFCQFQNRGSYTPNPGDLQALALRYQIAIIDMGKNFDDVARWCNRYALVPSDGHPQAAGHYLWFKQIEQVFECWDPIQTGQAQVQLPERIHPNSYGWEGDMVRFESKSPRFRDGRMIIIEDTAYNFWVAGSTNPVSVLIDGVKVKAGRGTSFKSINNRNASGSFGRLSLGDRHIVEVGEPDKHITGMDCKICPERRRIGVESTLWHKGFKKTEPFKSEWGAPYGEYQLRLSAGETVDIDVVGADLSIAYVDAPDNGILRVTVDGSERLEQMANQAFTNAMGQVFYMENRKGIRGLGYGLHTLHVQAVKGPAQVLGVFVYDSRANRSMERRLTGWAAAGERLTFSPLFRARPVVICGDGLRVEPAAIRPDCVTFSGSGPGWYEIVGE